jgi:hypothetical protein
VIFVRTDCEEDRVTLAALMNSGDDGIPTELLHCPEAM